MIRMTQLLIALCLISAFKLPANDRQIIDLNGTWQAHENRGLECAYPPPADGWVEDKVPQKKPAFLQKSVVSWFSSKSVDHFRKRGFLDFKKRTDVSAWYRRHFQMPQKQPGKIVHLIFDSITTKSVVWLNGQRVGETVTGAAGVRYDITPYIRWGTRNRLTTWVAGPEAVIDFQNDLFTAPKPYGIGICDSVKLEILSPLFIDDIFVKTSVKKQLLELETTLINRSRSDRTVTPTFHINAFSDGHPALSFSGKPVLVAAGMTKRVTFSKVWKNPTLWSPETPFLYVAKCKLSDKAGKSVDVFSQRFGFREFSVKGRGFLLNGKPFTLFRSCAHASLNHDSYHSVYAKEDPMRGHTLRNLSAHPYNHYRVWGEKPLVANMGDETGITLAQTLARFLPKPYPTAPDKRHLWLPNMKVYLRKLIRKFRNHPSIIIWNMTNENYWGSVPEDPEIKEICKQLVEAVRELDPTRPLDGDAEVGWDGLLDIISLHYPGAPGPLSKQYPNSRYVLPNDLYWLKDKGNRSWRASFDWDRPLSMGEYYGINAGGPDGNSCFGGEAVYDWTLHRKSPYGKKWLVVKQAAMLADVYRVQGVACINPWQTDGKAIMPRFGIRPLDFHPNFYSGEQGSRHIVVFSESATPLQAPALECILSVNDKPVWEKSIPVKLQRGANTFTIPFSLPQVNTSTSAELRIQLRYGFRLHRPVKVQHVETIYIMPTTDLKNLDAEKIALLDPSGTTAKRLNKAGLALTGLPSLDEGTLADKALLIVAGEATIEPWKPTITNFANQGGAILLLHRKRTEALGFGYPEIDKRHVTTRAWKRTYNHDILKGITNEQLSFWRPDNLVGMLNYTKPVDGDFRTLLDAGGLRGLEWTPLCETTLGKGRILLSQLKLLDRLTVEPMAGHLLKRLIDYGLSTVKKPTATLRILSQGNRKLEEVLKLCRITYRNGLQGEGPILWDATYRANPEEIGRMRQFQQAGGRVWLHGFSPETVDRTASLLPFQPELVPVNPRIVTAVRKSDSPLLNNLSSADFMWGLINLSKRGDYFDGAKVTAKLGSHELQLPYLQAGEPLLHPAFLTSIPAGQGTILFDTLNWEDAFEREGERVVRIVSALAMNMGVEISKPGGAPYDYFPIRLDSHANMGFVDEVADDGKGGWLDMGRYDLCYFLTNHTERMGADGVDDDGMPIAVEPFPENTRFRGIPFSLTAPKKNNGKSVIALRGNNRALKLPFQVSGIPVQRKADKLWFIHGASYVPSKKGTEIAKYVIRYQDGSTVDFPLRAGIEIDDWSDPEKPEKAVICWTGRNRKASNYGLFLTEWSNPNPEKVIQSLDVVGALTTAQLGLVGIAGGLQKKGSDRPLAKWTFSDFEKGKVIDSINGIALQARSRTTPSTVGISNKEQALKLNGTWLVGSLNAIEGLDPTKPYTTKITFRLRPLPAGASGYGIYQVSDMRSGFRIFVTSPKHGRRLRLAYYRAPDGQLTILNGKTKLDLEQFHRLRVTSGPSDLKVFLNGKLEVMTGQSGPRPYSGPLQIGHCSGGGYLVGLLRSLELSQ